MSRSPRYNLRSHRTSADPEALFVCDECKVPKPAKAFFRSNNKTGIKYSNRCKVCSNSQHGRDLRKTNQRLKEDPSFAMEMINSLGPEPIPIKDGWRKYNFWHQQKTAILAKAGLIPKKPFNIVEHVNRKVTYGRLTTTEAERIIEDYYVRHPETRPKPEDQGGVIKPPRSS